ncbi:hypothetical protein MaudCBS49596_005183 [Microsporum audouinii]
MLVKNPDKLTKLYEEIDHWYPAGDSRPADCEYSLSGMVYLQACVDEAMRLVPAQATGSPRQCPTDQNILGYQIPRGTTVFPITQRCNLRHGGMIPNICPSGGLTLTGGRGRTGRFQRAAVCALESTLPCRRCT